MIGYGLLKMYITCQGEVDRFKNPIFGVFVLKVYYGKKMYVWLTSDH